MRFAFITKNKDMLPINRLCQIMDVSPRGYRAFCNRPPSQSQRVDMVVLAHIREQFALSLGSYGRLRMTTELKELGLDVGHRRFGRLMKENGIKEKFKATTDSNHSFNIAPNLLNRDFSAEWPNRKWAGDISYVWTQEGWLYLSVILDLHSRRVIGWAELLPDEARFGDPGVEDGHCVAAATEGPHPSYGSWQPILFPRLSKASASERLPDLDERNRQLPR